MTKVNSDASRTLWDQSSHKELLMEQLLLSLESHRLQILSMALASLGPASTSHGINESEF